MAQQQQQESAVSATNQANDQQRKALLEEQDRTRMDGERQAQQQYEQAAAETNAYAQEHNRAMASMAAMLGEGGAGNTGNRKLSSLGIKSGQDLATLASNSTKAQTEISLGTAAGVNSTSSRIGSIRNSSAPSGLGAALQIGGGLVDYQTSVNKQKAVDALKTPTPKP